LVVLLIVLVALLAGGDNGTEVSGPIITQVVTQEAPTPRMTDTTTPPTTQPEGPTEIPATHTAPPATESPGPATNTPFSPTDTPLPSTNTPLSPTDTPLPPTDTPLPPSDTPHPPPPTARFGRLAFSSNRQGNPEIYVLNLEGGSPIRLTNTDAIDWLPDWSPDGRRIAFTSNRTGGYDLWVMESDGSGQTAWVTTPAWDDYPRWAPDGQRLSFSTTALTQGVPNSEIFVRQGNGNHSRITHSPPENQWADWSPDGRIIFTEGFKDDRNWDLFVVNAGGGNRALWLGGPTCDVQPAWSPDGQWIAFLRNSQDTNGNGRVDFEDAGDVWVGRASGGGLRQLTSGLWAATPAWSPDSKWIAFARVIDSNGNGRSDGKDAANILAVPLDGGDIVPLVQSPHRDGDPSWTW
jgi:Tol biopolymer transport system component